MKDAHEKASLRQDVYILLFCDIYTYTYILILLYIHSFLFSKNKQNERLSHASQSIKAAIQTKISGYNGKISKVPIPFNCSQKHQDLSDSFNNGNMSGQTNSYITPRLSNMNINYIRMSSSIASSKRYYDTAPRVTHSISSHRCRCRSRYNNTSNKHQSVSSYCSIVR